MSSEEHRQPVGCLLIGRTGRMDALRKELTRRGVETVDMAEKGDLLTCAQEGLRAARRSGGTCVAAEGELWAAALALAVQLSVDRVVLIAPEDRFRTPQNQRQRQTQWLKGFVRRNLFFCVSDVMVMEADGDRRMDLLCRRMCNARVRRVSVNGQRWQNGEQFAANAAADFLQGQDSGFALA